MKRLLLILIFITQNVFAQKIILDGFVYDKNTGEKIINANIYIKDLKTGTTTNDYGYYNLIIPSEKKITLTVGFVGYQNIEKQILLKKNTSINFELTPDNNLETVTLKVKNNLNVIKKDISAIDISIKQINKMPILGGESDIMKALQSFPGISFGKEGSSDLFVRGGSPDQNLILLDDVPLFYVNHLGGFASVFNTDALQSVKLIKGGFPARYSNRLSSIIDIRMKEGNRNKTAGNFSIGLLNAKFSLEGPINKKMSYMISARRMLYDLITKPISYFGTEKTFSVGYYFYDINAKLNCELNKKNHLYFSMYGGDDVFSGKFKSMSNAKTKFSKKWGNKLAALRWHHILNSSINIITVLSYSKYRLNIGQSSKSDDFNYNNFFLSEIGTTQLKTNLNYKISNNYKIVTGGRVAYNVFNPSTQVYKYNDQQNPEINKVSQSYSENTLDYNFFIENKLKINKNIFVNLGLVNQNIELKQKQFNSIEPRLSFKIKLNQTTGIKGGYSLMQQNLHMLSSLGQGMPVDLWLPATELAPPEKSEQYVIGFYKTFLNNKVNINIESYYKTINNLITYKPGANFSQFSNRWEEIILNNGKGKSFGIELLLQKNTGKHTGWVSYTYSKTTRYFSELNNGKPFSFIYDKPNEINIVYNYNFNKNIQFSATWKYATGSIYNMEISKYYDINDYLSGVFYNVAYEYSPLNSLRMKDFHRLDVGVNFIKQKKHGIRTWNFSIINVYNRQNPYFYYLEYEQTGNDTYKTVIKQFTLFPFLPSFSYSYKF